MSSADQRVGQLFHDPGHDQFLGGTVSAAFSGATESMPHWMGLSTALEDNVTTFLQPFQGSEIMEFADDADVMQETDVFEVLDFDDDEADGRALAQNEQQDHYTSQSQVISPGHDGPFAGASSFKFEDQGQLQNEVTSRAPGYSSLVLLPHGRKKKRRYDPEQRQRVRAVRQLGACLRCRVYKEKVCCL